MPVIEMSLEQLLGGATASEEDSADAERKRKMLAEMRREENEDPAIYCRNLIDLAAGYQNRPAGRFKVGELIQAVPASPYRFWTPKRPGIVVEVLAEPAFENQAQSSSPDFRLALDMRVATIRGGEFLIFHVHSGYFEKYTGPVLEI